MTLTLIHLAFAGIRKRLPASVLTVLVSGTAAATLVIALAIGSTTLDPWQSTFDAANGPHVFAMLSSEQEATQIANQPGIAESEAPVPTSRVTLTTDSEDLFVFVVGLSGNETINVPVQTDGSPLGDQTVLFERSLAEAIGVEAGDSITLTSDQGSVDLTAAGLAVSPTQPRYPRRNPGVVWVTRSTFEAIQPDATEWRWLLQLRLQNPDLAPAFASSAAREFPGESGSLEPWQDIRENALLDTQPYRIILIAYTVLLLAVGAAIIGLLIGARIASQVREIGLLVALGVTPRQVSAMLALETTVLALLGLLIGAIPGTLIAPILARSTSSTFISSPETSFSIKYVLTTAAVVLPFVAFVSYRAAARSSRTSPIVAMKGDVLALNPGSRLAHLSDIPALPLPTALGIRDMLARGRRAVWLLAAIMVVGAASVATLSIHHAIRAAGSEARDVPSELPSLIFSLDALLAIATFAAIVAVSLLSVRERFRDMGVLRTIGFTPAQIAASISGANALVALVGGLLAIPAGLIFYALLYTIASGEMPDSWAPWWWFAFVPLVLGIAAGCATIVPARFAARMPIAEAVRYE